MSNQGMGLDEFLNHSSSGGARGDFLPNWRKDPGNIKIWIHSATRFHSIWPHGWHKIKEVSEKGGGDKVLKVFGESWNCHETEMVLKSQHYRDPEGNREKPPQVCPICFMQEWIYKEIDEGRLSWTEPVFRFEGDDPTHAVELRAGGIVGLFNKKDLTKEEKVELRKAGVSLSEAWRESTVARCQYVFQVIDDDCPEDGVKIAREAGALGEKFKKAIRAEQKKRGDRGNPIKRPYPFEWSYDDTKSFADKYDVTALDEDEPSKAVREALRLPGLDIAKIVAPGDIDMLRAEMEAAACFDMPFDSFFEAAERAARSSSKTKSVVTPAAQRQNKVTPVVEKEEEHEGYNCDVCAKPIGKNDVSCEHCGTVYSEKDNQVEAIPCVDCKTLVPLEENGIDGICPKCSSVHRLTMPDLEEEGVPSKWEVLSRKPSPEPEEEKPKRGRRGRAVVNEEAKATTRRTRAVAEPVEVRVHEDEGDDIPF